LPNFAFIGVESFAAIGAEENSWSVGATGACGNDKGWNERVFRIRHFRIVFFCKFFRNYTLDYLFEFLCIEATTIVAGGDNSRNDFINVENFLGELCVFCNTFFNRLPSVSDLRPLHIDRQHTIRKRPSIIAIKPPVLVPPMRSKYSQGRGVFSTSLFRAISSMSSLRMKSDESPRTPPPSRDKMRGQCLISASFPACQ
jgi:hypothetical protein